MIIQTNKYKYRSLAFHLNLVEDGKYSNGVNGSDEGAKEESLKKAEPLLAIEGHSERSGSADPPQCDA